MRLATLVVVLLLLSVLLALGQQPAFTAFRTPPDLMAAPRFSNLSTLTIQAERSRPCMSGHNSKLRKVQTNLQRRQKDYDSPNPQLNNIKAWDSAKSLGAVTRPGSNKKR